MMGSALTALLLVVGLVVVLSRGSGRAPVPKGKASVLRGTGTTESTTSPSSTPPASAGTPTAGHPQGSPTSASTLPDGRGPANGKIWAPAPGSYPIIWNAGMASSFTDTLQLRTISATPERILQQTTYARADDREFDAWTQDGEAQVEQDFAAPNSIISECKWTTPLLVVPFPLALHSTVQQTASCTFEQGSEQYATKTDRRQVEITGRRPESSGGVSCNTWTIVIKDVLTGVQDGDYTSIQTLQFCPAFNLAFAWTQTATGDVQFTDTQALQSTVASGSAR